LGYAIGGGKIKIDPMKMEAILKWLVLTNVIEVRNFVRATQYPLKFMVSFSAVVAPLHAIKTSGKSFQSRNN